MQTGSLISQAMTETPTSTTSGGVKTSQIRETKPGVYEAVLTAGALTVGSRVGEVTLSSKT